MATHTKRKNKDVAGYLILNILAEIDGDFNADEGQVIADYIQESFPLGGNLEHSLEELSTTANEDYPILFQKCAEDFYADSTEEERVHFLQFALKLISADQNIDTEENWLVNKLYQYWDL